jgi:hypothetical protein
MISLQLLINTTDYIEPTLFTTHSQKPQGALNVLVTEKRYWALFYMPL